MITFEVTNYTGSEVADVLFSHVKNRHRTNRMYRNLVYLSTILDLIKLITRGYYCCYYFGVGAQGDHCTVTIYDLLCVSIWVLIIPDSSTRELSDNYQQRHLLAKQKKLGEIITRGYVGGHIVFIHTNKERKKTWMKIMNDIQSYNLCKSKLHSRNTGYLLSVIS
jgi:hypothetical protein